METPVASTPVRQPAGGARRIWLLNAAIAGTAVTLFLMFARHASAFDRGMHIPWWVLAVMFALAEVHVVHIRFRRDSESFSLNEIPLVLGLFFLSPMHLVLAQALGAGIALAYHRRQPPLKLVFNVGNLTLTALTASLIFRSLAHLGSPVSSAEITAAFVATTTTIVVSIVCVVAAISLAEGSWQPHMFKHVLGLGSIVTLANTSIALLGVALLRIDRIIVGLLAVPAVTLFFAYRAYASQREQHDSLQQLYESTRAMQGSLRLDEAMQNILERARAMFRAEIACITLFPSGKERLAQRLTLGPGDELLAEEVVLDPKEGVWARVAAEQQAILFARPIRNEVLRQYFAGRGMMDAMVAPLHGENAVDGTVLVGNRLGDVDTFTSEDLKLFETLANHASVSLRNARLVSQLRESLSHQKELNRMKDEFVATVSHELRTPLTSIQGFVKTLLRPELPSTPEEQESYLRIIDRQSDRLRGLIEDLLIVARIESHRILPAPTLMSLSELAREVTEEFLPESRGHGIRLESLDGLPAVRSDRESLHRILSNLLENALKYSAPATDVVIEGRWIDDGVAISITDTGPGVPVEQQEHIFERFYQVDQSTTRQVGGAGLGLYICRGLARQLGGRVWLERSDPNTGSTFTVWIPEHPTDQQALPDQVRAPVRPRLVS